MHKRLVKQMIEKIVDHKDEQCFGEYGVHMNKKFEISRIFSDYQMGFVTLQDLQAESF